MMDKVLKTLFQVQEFKVRNDDDFVDRLNRQYTPTLMCVFVVLVSMKQYVGDPINCWCPAQFTSSHQEYTNTVCWVSDTYYVPFERQMPRVEEPRHMISYYQWVPLILISQAAMFFVPYIMWRVLNRRAGINLAAVIEAATACARALHNDTREKTMRYMVSQMDGYLLTNRNYGKDTCSKIKFHLANYCCLFCGKLTGNYLVVTYLIVKLLYVGNAVGQLFLLDIFLGMNRDYHLYGIHVVKGMFEGSDWTSSERFPRVTLCDFEIRQQTNVHRYTVQCVLPINLFNEKIFVFLWFWLALIALITLFSFFHWCSKTLILAFQMPYIKRQLRAIDYHTYETKTAQRFVEMYLRRDGLLILRLVGRKAGEVIAAELLHGLWTNYGHERKMMGDNGGRNEPHVVRVGNRNPIVCQDVV